MDITYFLRERLNFIRQFYDRAVVPFEEIKRKIHDGEEPYAAPYSDDGEPPFVSEWIEADESIDVLGQQCISMLGTALHLYLDEFMDRVYGDFVDARKNLGSPYDNAKGKGWLRANRDYFKDVIGADWAESGANLEIIDEIVLARNVVQHPDGITSVRVKQTRKDFEKFKRSFFADEMEMRLYQHEDGTFYDWATPPWNLKITREKLEQAIVEVEKLCRALEEWYLDLTLKVVARGQNG